MNPKTGNEIDLRGVNLGQWLLWESYLWGLYPEEEGYQRYTDIPQNELLKKLDIILPESFSTTAFWNAYQQHFITEWDFQYLKSLGVNMVRVPLHYFMFEDEQGLAAIKKAISYCEEFEVFCLLDIHAVRGAQSSYSASDPIDGKVEFWGNEQYQEEYFENLKTLSDLSKNKSYVIGYDLLNEPEVDDIPMLRDFYLQAISLLRKRGDEKILVVETNKVSLNLSEIYLGDELENILYSVHYYGRTSGAKDSLFPVWQFATEKNIPIFIGEFGNLANDVFAQHSARYMMYSFEIYDFHYAYWPYKDLIPEVPTHDNNFGLFSGPDTQLWQEFFQAVSDDIPLREDFPFLKFFHDIRSENLVEKEFVVNLIKIAKQGIVNVSELSEIPEAWRNRGRWEERLKKWQPCDNKTFAQCSQILLFDKE